MFKPLLLDASALETMKAHAEATYPNECCGFFYGQEGDQRHISLARPVENSQAGDQRRRFEISPLDYMRAEQFALEQGLSLLGIYHSHPEHPAIPSEHDRVQAQPYFSYLIFSVIGQKVVHYRSWQLKEEQFEEETIVA
ncbi:MAG: M67 family metallopeptidase [Microscillaceae bacterium]